MSNLARELQNEVVDYLSSQISSVTFLAEDSKQIEFEIKNNLQKVGMACVVMTPEMQYIGRTLLGQAWDCKNFTVMMTEYVPINRASNKAEWKSGMDVAFEVTEKLAGPTAECGFGKFCPVKIEQGEDNGLLVVKATFDCSIVSKYDPDPVVANPVISPESQIFWPTLTVTMSCETEGASIRYTTNGLEPDENSNLYSNPIEIDSDMTFKAKAFKDNYTASQVTDAQYLAREPKVNWGSGSFYVDSYGNAEFQQSQNQYYYSNPRGTIQVIVKKNGITLYNETAQRTYQWNSTNFDWEKISQEVEFHEATSQNVKILDVIWSE